MRNVHKHKTQSRPFEKLLASDTVKVESSGEDPRINRDLASNLPHPRVNKTKQHTRLFHRNISHTYGSTGPSVPDRHVGAETEHTHPPRLAPPVALLFSCPTASTSSDMYEQMGVSICES